MFQLIERLCRLRLNYERDRYSKQQPSNTQLANYRTIKKTLQLNGLIPATENPHTHLPRNLVQCSIDAAKLS